MASTNSIFAPSEACGARWSLGTVLLAPLSAAAWGYATLCAIQILSVVTITSSYTCNDLKSLSQILPPLKTRKGRRDRNPRSFSDFMSIWMLFLAHLVAVAICARILSATADQVTEGKTRQWLFGYETKSLGEPWPDVLGVTVVLIICGMFMCGLEENSVFTYVMIVSLFLYFQFFSIFGILNLDFSKLQIIPNNSTSMYKILAAGSSIAYTYSVMLNRNSTNSCIKRKPFLITFIPTIILTILCYLHINISNGAESDGVLPIMSLFQSLSANWQSHIIAATSVCCASLALCELCPSLFAILVSLASSEWKILTRSMAYESPATGSPVLAVFTAGSLSAILAFACPLSHMVSLLNASHLLSIIIQGIQFTILRCVPTLEQMEQGAAEYKRLGAKQKASAPSLIKSKSHPWFVPSALRHTKTLQSIKSTAEKGVDERECLLMDEYSADIPAECGPSVEEHVAVEDLANGDTSSDDSTDIDEVVKEYQDRVKVVTTPPESGRERTYTPTERGALISCIGVVGVVLGSAFLASAICITQFMIPLLSIGVLLFLIGSTLSAIQPAHNMKSGCLRAVEGPITILFNILLLMPLLIDSWPAIIMFTGAGAVIYARCDRCCGSLATQRVTRVIKYDPLITSSTFAHVDTVYVTS